MSFLKKFNRKILGKSRFQDVIFITGILGFTIILVIGLFPKTDPEEGAARISFIYLLMVIPIIVAIYFIIISFKRKLYSESSEISSSITFKIALAFVFVAIFSSLPVIIITNNIINETLSQFINDETVNALEESLEMSHDAIQEYYFNIERELISLDYSLNNGTITMTQGDRRYIRNIHRLKEFNTIYYFVRKRDYYGGNELREIEAPAADPQDLRLDVIKKFLENTAIEGGYTIHNISIGEDSILLGKLYYNNFLILIYMQIPEKVYNRTAIFKNSLSRFNSEDFLKPYFRMGIGIVLLIIAILVIIVALSLGFFLSRNISRPVLQMVEAAGRVASGDFNIRLNRNSSDELTLLFNSFNQMVNQLNESRRMTFQTQKLEAWREVAKKLLHEIKNPLTPIKLSAERIRKKSADGDPDLGGVIISGTDTIIEEVSVLTMMLGEFSKFARLPEMKREFHKINPILKNCVNSFAGHGKITLEYHPDDSIPDLFIDKILLRQAFTNILQNAVEAIKVSGKIIIKSSLITEENKKKARIIIQDNGVGIKEEDLGRVFDPTFTTKEHGSGIGLAIVNKIILEHNGKIVCNSTYGSGTEFIIDLPV